MKNLFLSITALSFILACKKSDTKSNTYVADSVNINRNYPDTSSVPQDSQGIKTSHDSINTKTHTGGRKTSNNNTGNATGNINAAVSDSLQPKR